MEKNIVLIGFMGSGKTSVGKILADSMGFSFCDTDEMILKRAGLPTIRQIFDVRGEEYFRTLEREVVAEASGLQGAVIATGGGVVKDAGNMAALRENGVVVYLACGADVILKRIGNRTDRPLIYGKSPKEIEEILKEREPLYANHDICVDVSAMTPLDVAKAIMVAYRKHVERERRDVG